MTRRLSVVAAVALSGAVLSSCSSPPSRFYTLSATGTATEAPLAVSVAVGRVSLPFVIDRPQIVVNVGVNEVRLDDFNRWASPLADNIERVLVTNLSILLATSRVTLAAEVLRPEPDFRVAVEVQRFESVPGGAATVEAVWTVRRAADRQARTGRTTAHEPVSEMGFQALAAAHSRGIARMSEDIAAAVRGLAEAPVNAPPPRNRIDQ